MFSVEKQETLNKIATYWLPFVRDNSSEEYRKPVILVGNKIDLIDYSVIDVRIFRTHIVFIILSAIKSISPLL